MNKQVTLESVEWLLVMMALRKATNDAASPSNAVGYERIRDSIRVQINP